MYTKTRAYVTRYRSSKACNLASVTPWSGCVVGSATVGEALLPLLLPLLVGLFIEIIAMEDMRGEALLSKVSASTESSFSRYASDGKEKREERGRKKNNMRKREERGKTNAGL